jgi:hypothetical protein
MSRKRSRSPVEKPDFTPSGILSKYEKRKNGEIELYSEPLDSHLPTYHWQLFQFKESESIPYNLHSQTYFQIGRDLNADIRLNSSSISKQHAVLQFRMRKKEANPFIIDLGSKFGSFLNGKRIEEARFVELRHKDLICFGRLKDEFVLIKGDKLREEVNNDKNS